MNITQRLKKLTQASNARNPNVCNCAQVGTDVYLHTDRNPEPMHTQTGKPFSEHDPNCASCGKPTGRSIIIVEAVPGNTPPEDGVLNATFIIDNGKSK